MARPMDILIVEDDRDTLGGWMELLGRAGHRVVGAATFDEARRALTAHPDLLITDIRLGPYNGLQLVIRARATNPRMPAIVLTGYHDSLLQAEAEQLDAVYLEKPVDADELLALVARAAAGIGSPHC
jgi:DNA-binding NtrC family response regulator